jgi:hypothetical protein
LVVELGFGGLLICVLDKKLGKMRLMIDDRWTMAAAAVIWPLWVHTPGKKAHNNQLTSYATGLHC